MFVERATSAPDHYCVPCVKAARLALAAESAPKPSDAGWPKPRPISEAPTDETFLAYVPAARSAMMESGWFKITETTDAHTGLRNGWVVLGATPEADRHYTLDELEPTHFLPLPPEVR